MMTNENALAQAYNQIADLEKKVAAARDTALEDAARACEELEEIEYEGRQDFPETATQVACAKAIRALIGLAEAGEK